jgi:hypothetical protein
MIIVSSAQLDACNYPDCKISSKITLVVAVIELCLLMIPVLLALIGGWKVWRNFGTK